MDIYDAFGNRVRVKLIQCLARRSKNVTELIQTCGLSQSAVSQHLLKLKQLHVVVAKKRGKEMWYSLANKKVAHISNLMLSLEKEEI